MENDWLYNKSSYGLLTTNLESSNLTGLVNFFWQEINSLKFPQFESSPNQRSPREGPTCNLVLVTYYYVWDKITIITIITDPTDYIFTIIHGLITVNQIL